MRVDDAVERIIIVEAELHLRSASFAGGQTGKSDGLDRIHNNVQPLAHRPLTCEIWPVS
jgi:hypothetical protein